MAVLLQFAPIVAYESRYGLREYRLPVPAASAARAVVGDLIENRGLVLEIVPGKYKSWNRLKIRCNCGKVTTSSIQNIASGKSKSCGHLRGSWARRIYSVLPAAEQRDLFHNVCERGSRRAADLHNLPKFAVDIATRQYVSDLLEREDVGDVRRVVKSAARFNDGVKQAQRYFDLSSDEVKAILARSQNSPTVEAKFELTDSQKATLLAALGALEEAADPMFRDLGLSKSAEHLMELMEDTAETVALVIGDDLFISAKEFVTPETAAAAKSHTRLDWIYAALGAMDENLLTPALRWLRRTLKLNIAFREARRKKAMEQIKGGLKPRRSRPSDRFGWKAPGIATGGAVAVIRGAEIVQAMPAAA